MIRPWSSSHRASREHPPDGCHTLEQVAIPHKPSPPAPPSPCYTLTATGAPKCGDWRMLPTERLTQNIAEQRSHSRFHTNPATCTYSQFVVLPTPQVKNDTEVCGHRCFPCCTINASTGASSLDGSKDSTSRLSEAFLASNLNLFAVGVYNVACVEARLR